MKKFFTVVTALVLSLSTMVSLTVNAFAAPATNDVWSVGWTEDKKDFIGWRGDGGEFAVDTGTYTGNSRFSIKLTNTKADNYTSVSKVVKVEPLTTYKFSAMVKYSGEKPKSVSDGKHYGALLRQLYVQENGDWNCSYSNNVISNKWTKVECTLTTLADQNEILLSFYNGFVDTGCKGTAWFSDIKLEKAETDNKWNILAVTFTDIDANVKYKGKKIHYTASINSKDMKLINDAFKKLPESLEKASGGLMTVDKLTRLTVSTPTDSLTKSYEGYKIDFNAKDVSRILDKYMDKEIYNQIIIIAPLKDIQPAWSGASVGFYRGAHVVELRHDSAFSLPIRAQGTIIHEMAHGMESRSKVIDPSTPDLHSYQTTTNILDRKTPELIEAGLIDWYGKYMTRRLKGGKGLHPSVFNVLDHWSVVDDDMTVGGEIKEAARLDISKCEIAPIEDKIYSGKKKGAALTITDGKYTLKKDIDYTVKYDNNKNVGTARVTVTGKGIYKGTLKTTFRIVAEKPSAKLVKSGEYLKLTWSKDPDAKKYCIWQSVDGKNFKKLRELDSAKTTLKIKYNKKHTYQYAVTAYDKETKKWSDYIYSNKI